MLKFPWQNFVTFEGDLGGTPPADPAPTPDPAPVTPVAADPPQPDPTPDPAPQPDPAPEPVVPVRVFQQRVAQLTAQRQQMEAQLEALRQQRQQASQDPDPAPTPGLVLSPQQLEEAIQHRAAQMADHQQFVAKSNSINAAGLSKFPDFGPSIVAINSTYGTMPREFIEQVAAAGETDEGAAEIFYSLGKDLAKAGHLMTLPPSMRSVELVKYAQSLKNKAPAPAPKVSNAPAPIPPVVGNGNVSAPKDLSDPKLPIEEFVRLRREQRAQRGRR